MPILVDTCRGDRQILEVLLDEYLEELSAFRDRQVGARRAAEYPFLDHLWNEPGRHAFFVSKWDRPIGFLILRRVDETPSYELAELFVKSNFRRSGLGAAAVHEALARLPGAWELQVHASNESALKFWECVIARAANGECLRSEITSSDGRRVQFNFHVSAASLGDEADDSRSSSS